MSTESHNTGQEPRHTDVSFEERDIKASTIYGYLFVLAWRSCFLADLHLHLSASLCISRRRPIRRHPAVSRGSWQGFSPAAPEPRLQGVPGHESDPQADLRRKNQEDTEANERLEWIDKPGGIAQIPVKDAMKIVAEKDCPRCCCRPRRKRIDEMNRVRHIVGITALLLAAGTLDAQNDPRQRRTDGWRPCVGFANVGFEPPTQRANAAGPPVP